MEKEKERNTELFERMPVARAVTTMAIPTIIGQLIILIYNMADTFFIGRVNNPYMVAGASLILPIFNVCAALAAIAGTGGGTLIARLLGMGQGKEARPVAAFSVWFAVGIGLVFSVMTGSFMTPLLRFLGASRETIDYARRYALCVIVLGAVPSVLSITMGHLLRSVGCSKQAGFGMSMGGVINILLDPLFMFVLLPKGQEIVGAGLATAISNILACVYFFTVARRLDNPILKFSPRNLFPGKKSIISFFAVGIPASIGPFLFDMNGVVLNRLMSGYSDTALAAIGIVLKAERLPTNIGIGLCLGMVPLAAYNFSSGDHQRMERIVRFTYRTGVLVSFVSIVFYELFALSLIRFFIADEATVALGSVFLRIRALATPLMFLSFVFVHFFQAVGRGEYSLMLASMRWLAVNIPMLFLLNAVAGMYGLVWSQLAGDIIVASTHYLIYRGFRRRHGIGTAAA